MKFWVISDTHFGHDKLIEYCGRPENFSEIELKNLKSSVREEDILIHLGDFCIGNDAYWTERFMETPGKKWLARGNHDGKSNSWYLSHGWDFVGEAIELEQFAKRIVFTHIPKDIRNREDIDINIHGHFHNTDHRSQEPQIRDSYTPDRQILVAVEYTNYKPILLEELIKELNK